MHNEEQEPQSMGASTSSCSEQDGSKQSSATSSGINVNGNMDSVQENDVRPPEPYYNESSPLLEQGRTRANNGDFADDAEYDEQWGLKDDAGAIHTSSRHEAGVLASYCRPLIVTFLLQYSIPVVSVVTVGHIGKAELGAVSISSMTANLTGVVLIEGLSTSLDTLCSQAYGSGRKKLVGVQFQRLLYFLLLVNIPIAIIFLYGTEILSLIIPDQAAAELAGLYLKVLIFGMPGYSVFTAGKRFVQAQGLFHVTMYVLLIGAPVNALLHWLFVWKLQWGYVGAPTAVVVTENLLPLLLFLYVRFVDGMDCWDGLNKHAFRNWSPMIKLAIPGLAMVLAEMLAFEILTLSASWMSTTHLAAQSVLSTLASVAFQLPYSISIAASTRLANLVGAKLPNCARVAMKMSVFAACIVGTINMLVLGLFRHQIPKLFTSDADVHALIEGVLPLVAAFQLVDATATTCSGLLRGLGKQSVGGWVNIVAYYGVAIPISFMAGFKLDWKLYGLWSGAAIALVIISAVEGVYLARTNLQKIVTDAEKRNALG